VSWFVKPGDVYGLLTVIEKTERREEQGVIWRLRCACGNEVFTYTGRLRTGSKWNCGCTKKLFKRRPKITKGLADLIRTERAAGMKLRKLARDYGVHVSSISRIVNGFSHKL
jgi:hypothetical protein